MPRFAKLDPLRASFMRSLFPPSAKNIDLQIVFQNWEREEVELSRAQIERTLAHIHASALPRAREFVRNSPSGALQEEAEEWVDAWQSLVLLLESAR